jgi:hypothetical protein
MKGKVVEVADKKQIKHKTLSFFEIWIKENVSAIATFALGSLVLVVPVALSIDAWTILSSRSYQWLVFYSGWLIGLSYLVILMGLISTEDLKFERKLGAAFLILLLFSLLSFLTVFPLFLSIGRAAVPISFDLQSSGTWASIFFWALGLVGGVSLGSFRVASTEYLHKRWSDLQKMAKEKGLLDDSSTDEASN